MPWSCTTIVGRKLRLELCKPTLENGMPTGSAAAEQPSQSSRVYINSENSAQAELQKKS